MPDAPKLYEGYVKFPNGTIKTLQVMAPDWLSALQMLRAYGECHAANEVR